MTTQIEAILFDIGGTLRYTEKRTRAEKKDIIAQMMAAVDAAGSSGLFARRLAARARAYKRWAGQTCVELNEGDLWTRWMLPDYPTEEIRAKAVALNQMYRAYLGQRIPYPDSRDVITQLFRRGYRLGVVSNTTSSVEVPELLRQLEISGCFETVVLSAVSGTRKPSPAILLEAAARMGIAPEKCAYIGDRIDRDVAAAHAAGFAMTVIIDPAVGGNNSGAGTLSPDHTVKDLCTVLDHFPPRPAPRPAEVYAASLSTMYAIHNFPSLADFIEYAHRSGFQSVELNHRVNSAMLEGISLQGVTIPSVHEPCPADISEAELKKRGWLISSTNETHRAEGVKAIKRSIDLAASIGAKTIVIHAGEALPDEKRLEHTLRQMIDAGQRETAEYHAVQAEMLRIRAAAAAAGMQAVQKSLAELLAYAAPHRICLGLENRYHYLEFPLPDELEILLGLAGAEQIGFIFDFGHAAALDRLGFVPQMAWLERFSNRIVGTHIHDVRGTTDHFAPGRGSINFGQIARYLPENAFRTCELQTINTPEMVKAGMMMLADTGCVQKFSRD